MKKSNLRWKNYILRKFSYFCEGTMEPSFLRRINYFCGRSMKKVFPTFLTALYSTENMLIILDTWSLNSFILPLVDSNGSAPSNHRWLRQTRNCRSSNIDSKYRFKCYLVEGINIFSNKLILRRNNHYFCDENIEFKIEKLNCVKNKLFLGRKI